MGFEHVRLRQAEWRAPGHNGIAGGGRQVMAGIFRFRTITAKLLALYLPLVSLSVLVIFAVIDVRYYFNQRDELVHGLKNLMAVQSSAFAAAVWEFDDVQIAALLHDLEKLPHVRGAVVSDVSGNQLGSVGDIDSPPESPEFRTARKIIHTTGTTAETVGILVVTVHGEEIRRGLVDRLIADLLILVVLAATLVTVTTISARRIIGRPINRLRASIERMKSENVREAVDWDGNDELGQVVHAYNEMQEKQATTEDELKTHQNHLEDLVDSRTSELVSAKEAAEEANKELAERLVDLANARRASMNMTAEAEESRKRAEEMREEAEAATRAKSLFLAAMSHEIRTPMNGVVGMIDLLRETELDTDQRQMMKTVRESAFSLLQIINDILDFSKIEAGKLELEVIPVSILDTIEGVVDTLAPNAGKKDLTLLSFVDPAIPDRVLTDQVRLRQILFNLGGNAIKFTETTPEKAGLVVVRADRLDEGDDETVTVRYSVVDNGIGISKEAQETLFEAFTQAETSTTRRYGGTGLGLSICVRLVDLMGGRIEVESELGAGSAFSAAVTHGTVETDAPTEGDDTDLADLRIILASGLAERGEFLSRYLRHWKAEVDFFDDLETIHDMARSAVSDGRPVDVIVIDYEYSDDRRTAVRDAIQGDDLLGDVKFLFLDRWRQRGPRIESSATIQVDANPIRRSTFLTAIAVAVGRASPEIRNDKEVRLSTESHKAPTVEEAERLGELILVAEDNLTNQDVILRQLNLLGYAAEIFDDGQQAINAWRDKKYAMLLTDCHMPNMDGYQLTAGIRDAEDEIDARFPIVAITANALQGEAEKCIAAGMDDYLSKPLEMDKLKQVLRKWMPARAEADYSAPPTVDIRPPDDHITEVDMAEVADVVEAAPDSQGGNGGAGEVIDPSALKGIFGDDDDTFREILQEFVDPAAANIKEITDAYDARSAMEIGAAAHKLKSSSRAIGANALADLCHALETAGKTEDWAEIEASAPRLGDIFRAVTDYIATV
jgi:signal transduction histidine kinase/CheY-like chemotaxis protein/HPt (histidine-containing phosphotransfer) domain-containing protein